MSRERGTLLRSEVLHHVIGEANAAIEQLAVAGGAVVRDSRLQQMAHAVELVGAIHFGEAFGRALARTQSKSRRKAFAKCSGRMTSRFMSVNNRNGKNRPGPIGCTLTLTDATRLSRL